MFRGKSVLCLVLFWFLNPTCFTLAQEPESGVTDQAIKIGTLCPLSGSTASRGQNFLEGLRTFFNHVNDLGGIHERSIVLLAQDDGDDPDQGVAAVRQMLAEHVVFGVVSASGVPTTQALLDRGILTDDIPTLVSGVPSKSLFSGFRQNMFFLGMPYGDQITLAIEYLLKRRPGMNPRMGLLSQESFLGKEVQEGFHRACKHYGLEIVGDEQYEQGTYYFAPFVDRLWSTQADHIVLGSTPYETVQIIQEASRLGWFPQFLGPSSTAEPEILIEAGESADDYLVSDFLAKPWERQPGVTLMVGHMQKYYPRKNRDALSRNHVLGYVSGLLFAEALLRAGKDPTRAAFIDALEHIHDLNTHGLTGIVGYKNDSHFSDLRGRVFRFDTASGCFLPLTDWSQPMLKIRLQLPE